ncbi:MAG: serine hydrolase [Bdellovibrionales bacterium]
MIFFRLVLAFQLWAAPKAIDYPKFEKFVQDMMTEFHVPGMAIGVVNKNGPVYMKGFGVRAAHQVMPVTEHTLFAIGSTTKAFTATSLGILVDRGLLGWDQPIVEKYLSEFSLLDPLATQMITTRDLLTHRSGLPRHDLVWYGSPDSRVELIRRIRYLQPTAGLREKTQYQNGMFMVAGYLAGQVAGTSWEDFVSREILQKIGMSSTLLSVNGIEKSLDYAVPHRYVNGEIQEIPFRNIDAVAPAGAMNSSVEDMGRWLRLQLNEGELEGQRIISKATLAEIHKPQMLSDMLGFNKIFPEFGLETYGMGWFVDQFYGKKLIHHGGGIDGFITFVGFMPELDLGIVAFANAESLAPYMAALAYLDMSMNETPAPWLERLRTVSKPHPKDLADVTPTVHPLTAYVGTYSHPAYGEMSVTVLPGGDGLELNHHAGKMAVAHYADEAFYGKEEGGKVDRKTPPAVFQFGDKNAPDSLTFKADEVADPVKFVRVPGAVRPNAKAGVLPTNRAPSTWLERVLDLK